MSDRLRARLRALDRPEEPSPAFRESLYQQLARSADIAPPTDLPLAAPVRRRVASGRRRWLPLLVAATVATSLAGGLAALSTRPAEQACEPALAQRLIEAAPHIDYTYTAEGIIDRDWAPTSGGDLRLEGTHRAPDRSTERYLEGERIALMDWGATEAVRIGEERWLSVPFEGEMRPWMSAEAVMVQPGFPNLALLPRDRVASLLSGSTDAPGRVDWTALPAAEGVCSLTGTIVPSPTSPARRVLTVEVARDADLPLSIHEEWFDLQTPHGQWIHDLTWRFEPLAEAPLIDPPASDLVQRTFSLDDIGALPTPQAVIDGTGSLVVDFAPDDPQRGDVRVTILEVREDTAYGEVVAYPGTTFLAVHMRQEALQPSGGTQGTLGLHLVPSGGGYPIGSPPPYIEGGPEPALGTHLDLARGETLEGWMHHVVPATGALDLQTTAGTPVDAPTLVVRLRPDVIIGSGVVDGVPWKAVAYVEFGGRLCAMVGDRSGEDTRGGACGPAGTSEPGIVFASMSGQPRVAHGVTGAEVATVRLETTGGDVDVAVSSLASLGVSRRAFAVAVPSGAEVIYFVALDVEGVEVGRSVGPAAPTLDGPAP
ncbi:MAG: hypothetical protein M3395_04380 [Chloroflexota bacterium]|nr:hypothetical protein [Chloroflexota bacterium]